MHPRRALGTGIFWQPSASPTPAAGRTLGPHSRHEVTAQAEIAEGALKGHVMTSHSETWVP